MSRRDRLVVTLVSQQLDEPSFMLDLFVQYARGQVIRAWVFSKSHVTHFGPAADGAPLRLQQKRKNVGSGRRIRKLGGTAPRHVMKLLEVVWEFAPQFIDAG